MPGIPQLLKGQIRRWTPKPLFNLLEYQRQRMRLRKVPRDRVDFEHLGGFTEGEMARLFDPDELNREWSELEGRLREFGVWNAAGATGGIDLKVLYFLARVRRFQSILEVGTHVGGSTLALAWALDRREDGGLLVTVDIADVNDSTSGPWLKAGLPKPPREMVRGLDVDVSFVTSRSVEFLGSNERRFDFVYLDGDHNSETVYREILLAAGCLRDGGLIALHDYSSKVVFPTLLDGRSIPGPYLATRRVVSEVPGVTVHSFQSVPWDDGDRVSYVAVLGKARGGSQT